MSTNKKNKSHEIFENNCEPIAIIGMSCRFPGGANTPDKYWKLLVEGQSTTGYIPEWRWESYRSSSPKIEASLDSATQLGSFLSDIKGFDADFFGISGREAEFIDPQQRLILELSWEALERAGLIPSSLKGTDVGVYMAANSFDFGHQLMSHLSHIHPWTVNGGLLFGIANRVSYALDFRGPSMVVDTACAGSLVTLHLACQALHSQEIPLALVGGVNIISNPGMTIALDAAGATAPDGKSKTFDQSANGYGRGEGAGIVVLKRLSDAQKDGDKILALVKGSGVFQDGRTVGMMAPNGEAQKTMLQTVYKRYGISPLTIDYIEAHGTGTPAGDKEEVSALKEVFGKERDENHKCRIGSVKPNIGHLEAGAGIAGLIKVVLSLKHNTLPSSLYTELTTQVDWKTSGLEVVKKSTPWSSSPHHIRRAGVSCFGVGGTISHAIIEEAPSPLPNIESKTLSSLPHLFPLSARSQESLKRLASQLSLWIEQNPDIPLEKIGNSLSHCREHLSKRVVVLASTREELIEGLKAFASGTDHSSVITGNSSGGVEKGTVWVFSGHGAQWPGMAVDLLEKNSAFQNIIRELDPIFKKELGYTAGEAILESNWNTVERVQAITFAIQLGLAAVLENKGLRPSALMGHSVGEVAAAVVGGALTMKDAAQFACRRAKIYQHLAGQGEMALVRLPFEETQKKIKNTAAVDVAIAASSESTIIAGDATAIDTLVKEWKKERIPVKKITSIDAAFHSFQLDPLLPSIGSAAEHLVPHTPNLLLYTTTLADSRSLAPRNAEFWVTNSRGIVHLRHAVEAALEDGFTKFLEISSSPIVVSSIRETASYKEHENIVACPTLRPQKSHTSCLAASLATLFCNGETLEWEALYGPRDIIDLPTMAWQHQDFWPSFPLPTEERAYGHAPQSHTLLGKKEYFSSTPPLTVWKSKLDFESRPYPGTHPLFGVEIIPAAVLLNTFMNTGEEKQNLKSLKNIKLHTPIAVENPLHIQIIKQDDVLRILTQPVSCQDYKDPTKGWTTHTTALIDDASYESFSHPSYDLVDVKQRCKDSWSWNKIEELYRKRGIGDYGFPWRLDTLHRGGEEMIASFSSQTKSLKAHSSWAELLDAALTICPLLLPDDEILRMPSYIDHISVKGFPPSSYSVYAKRVDSLEEDDCRLHVSLLDREGKEIATLEGIVFGVLENKAKLNTLPTDIIFKEAWHSLENISTQISMPPSLVFVGEDSQWTQTLIQRISQSGIKCSFTSDVSSLQFVSNCRVIVLGLPFPEGENIENLSEQNAWLLIDTVQTLLNAHPQDKKIELCCLTQGVRESLDERALAQAPLWGIGRIIAGERPELWKGLLDINTQDPLESSIAPLLKAFSISSQEDVISINKDGLQGLRLVPHNQLPANHNTHIDMKLPSHAFQCRADATYLITGGLGALGIESAQYLINKGARRLILAGRRGLPPRETWSLEQDPSLRPILESIQKMESSGVTVIPLQLDVSQEADVQRKLSLSALNLPPIRGIVHGAGIFTGSVLGQITKETLHSILEGKVWGAMALHRQFPPGSLDFFIHFSSSGQFARLTGQTCYAAANAFLDRFSRYRNRSGIFDSMTFGWMAWQGMGMSHSIDATMIEARSHGMEAIDLHTALRAWQYCEQVPMDYVALFTPFYLHNNGFPLFREISRKSLAETVLPESQGLCIPTENRLAWLVSDVRALVATELNLEKDKIEIKRPLIDMGIDSLITVSLRVRLKQRYAFEFPPTLLWNNPSIEAIARFIYENLNASEKDKQGLKKAV